MKLSSTSSLEDVLDAFAAESNPTRGTLERYLRAYPEHATELVDLSRELSRVLVEDKEPLSSEDKTLIETLWKKHVQSSPVVAADPFAQRNVVQLRELATRLEVPRQVVTAFRQHRVLVASIPRRFLKLFAAALEIGVDDFRSVLAIPPVQELTESYKADTKPKGDTQVSFEQLLIEAGVPDKRRAELMAEND